MLLLLMPVIEADCRIDSFLKCHVSDQQRERPCQLEKEKELELEESFKCLLRFFFLEIVIVFLRIP